MEIISSPLFFALTSTVSLNEHKQIAGPLKISQATVEASNASISTRLEGKIRGILSILRKVRRNEEEGMAADM